MEVVVVEDHRAPSRASKQQEAWCGTAPVPRMNPRVLPAWRTSRTPVLFKATTRWEPVKFSATVAKTAGADNCFLTSYDYTAISNGFAADRLDDDANGSDRMRNIR